MQYTRAFGNNSHFSNQRKTKQANQFATSKPLPSGASLYKGTTGTQSAFQERNFLSQNKALSGELRGIDMQNFINDPIEIKPIYVMGMGECPLALYPLLPDFEPEKVVVLYHEVGAYHTEQSLKFASQLVDDHNIAVYLVELRGHGLSAGATLSKELDDPKWLLKDIDLVLKHTRTRHSDATIYLGGHGQSCALLSHYASKGCEKNKINGLIFIAPYFGPFSHLYDRDSLSTANVPYKQVNFFNLAIHALSAGRFRRQRAGWKFCMSGAPQISAKKQRIVAKKTFSTNWAYYLHTLAPSALIANIQTPIYLFLPKKGLCSQKTTVAFFKETTAKVKIHYSASANRFDILEQIAKPLSHDLAMSAVEG